MPELPEVEITTRKLQALSGKMINGFWSDWPKGIRVAQSAREINQDIAGCKVLAIRRRGKAVVFELSGSRILAFHQRMSGRIIIAKGPIDFCDFKGESSASYNRGVEKVSPLPRKIHGIVRGLPEQKLIGPLAKHIHHKIFFNKAEAIFFHDPRKFGIVWYGKPENVFADNYFKNLGPDALGISREEFCERLKRHKGAIKALLLRQDFVAGIGNIVADEALWEAKIYPNTPCAILVISVKLTVRLHNAVQNVLRRGIEAGGTTLRDWGHPDGAVGGFQKHLRVYGRANNPCPRCKEKITRIIVAGRGTSFCPRCQTQIFLTQLRI